MVLGILGPPLVDRSREGSPSAALGYLLAPGEVVKGKLDARFKLADGTVGVGVEVRGSGLQTMVCGVHPEGAKVTARLGGLGQATPVTAAQLERCFAVIRKALIEMEGVEEVSCPRDSWPDLKAEAAAKAAMVKAVANGAGAGKDWAPYVEKKLGEMETAIGVALGATTPCTRLSLSWAAWPRRGLLVWRKRRLWSERFSPWCWPGETRRRPATRCTEAGSPASRVRLCLALEWARPSRHHPPSHRRGE